MKLSKDMEEYFQEIDKNLNKAYLIAKKARSKGYDPSKDVEILLAKNMAERVQGLISVVAPQIVNSGMVERLKELESKYGLLDWRVALVLGKEIAQEKFCKFNSKIEAMEVGVRAGLAYVTLGVTSTPLEGIVELKAKKRKDGKEYIAIYYAGPIRASGATACSVSVILTDYISKVMGYSPYDPTGMEIKRMVREVYDYHERITNLQYLPNEEELKFLVKNLPVQIEGIPSEIIEVSNYKDLERIDTNRLRNGVCLILAESLAQKSPKIYAQLSKWGKDFNLENWDFLKEFLKIQKKERARGDDSNKENGRIRPDYNYIKDLVAGRPILTHPLEIGGFRLRYGRTRTSGLASVSIHPATMIILNNFIGTGTQLRYERPGKSTAVAPCDSIEGPIVKLNNGEVLFLETEEQARPYIKNIKEILFLGDILINYGEFLNRAHILLPPGYCEEWWVKEVDKAIKEKNISKEDLGIKKELFKDPIKTKIPIVEAINISNKLNVPLHPRYTYHWKDLLKENFLDLINWLEKAEIKEDNIILPYDKENTAKRTLELLGVPHIVKDDKVIIEGDWAKALAVSLNFHNKKININKIKEKIKGENVLEIINNISEVRLRDKSGFFIGARMGRPEKAKQRKLIGSPQVLFPVGDEGGRLRSFQAAVDDGKVRAQFPIHFCKKCNQNTIYPRCENCESETEKLYYCEKCRKDFKTNKCQQHGDLISYKLQNIEIKRYFDHALKKLKLKETPELIKGVRGTSNKEHIPENLIKGFLRAMYSIYVNKDGTTRYDMTEMPMTHFKPEEIGTSVEKLKELGYKKDMNGDDFVSKDQILEIKPQDVVLPSCPESSEEGADKVLLRVSQFTDALLKKFYGLEPFYNLKSEEDLVGHLVVGLAPHTAAGIIGRIIGFSKTQGCFAHPMWHSAQRRDCEGDEDCVILLMDVLLNFSKHFLPAHRGATQDACLVLTSEINPAEVDEMVLDLDVAWDYPLEFYEAAEKYTDPSKFKIETLHDRLGTEKQYENFGFTHDTNNINMGVRYSAYKNIPTMMEKVYGQMDIAKKIRAVNEVDVARLVVERHFLRDIKGNLRKFSSQQFRCVNCNEKYRRVPLIGKCLKCDGKLLLTVSEGTVRKYSESTKQIIENYPVSTYLSQQFSILERRVDDLFGKKDRQLNLNKFNVK